MSFTNNFYLQRRDPSVVEMKLKCNDSDRSRQAMTLVTTVKVF